MNQLEEDINQFADVHDSSQFLRFSNLVMNITATVASFGNENEANHKQVLRKLMNTLPDYLKVQWAIHAEHHQSGYVKCIPGLGQSTKLYCVND
jgi:hypothetical protein